MGIYHGTAISKENIDDIVKKGDVGIITAYLPDMDRFSVFFGNNKWITFNYNEKWFLNNFDIIQENLEK